VQKDQDQGDQAGDREERSTSGERTDEREREGSIPDSDKQTGTGGGEQADEQSGGADRQSERQHAGRADDLRGFDASKAGANQGAFDQLDRLGGQVGPEEAENAENGEKPGAGGRSTVVLMEQLLDQVEGNPAYLMKNQFMLEEQRMRDKGGQLYEPRPW
jgi:hypothetical protein